MSVIKYNCCLFHSIFYSHSLIMSRYIKALAKLNPEIISLNIEKFSKIIFQLLGFNLIPLPRCATNYVLLKAYLKLWVCFLILMILISAGTAIS